MSQWLSELLEMWRKEQEKQPRQFEQRRGLCGRPSRQGGGLSRLHTVWIHLRRLTWVNSQPLRATATAHLNQWHLHPNAERDADNRNRLLKEPFPKLLKKLSPDAGDVHNLSLKQYAS